MEDDQQGLLIPLEIIILGFAAHFTSGNNVESVEDEALFDLQSALELEISRRGAVVH
jgi:hypothetical protein